MDTKYNLNITTSGEGGDNATTSITTTDANKLADLLKLAGMSQAHPVALNVSPDEEHDMPCSTSEGESWDNEPETFIHSPEEVFKVGDDLHKVKKSHAPVAGGDNPMALESVEDKLRGMYSKYIAEHHEKDEDGNVIEHPIKKEDGQVDEAIRIVPRSKAEKFDLMMKRRSSEKEERAINTEKSKRDTAKSAGYDAVVAGKDIGGIAKEETETNTDINDIRRLAGLKEQPMQEDELSRMANDQYEELAGYIDQIDTTYADYEGKLMYSDLYSALNDGYYGEITDKEDREFNALVYDLDDLIEKAAKQQGVEVPTRFQDDGVRIPDDISREMETVKAKMKALFKDPSQMRPPYS